MKNDQAGDRPRDPQHVYANPLEPTVSPILALGVYWSMLTFDQGNGRLFPGGSQYDRFRKQLGRTFNQDDVSNEHKRRAVKPDEIGSTHSLRKGAATFASSGSTACPSSTTVNLRAGWSLGGVQNTCLRYEAAGDMHVGRTVTGLSTDSHTFACLPPHFSSCDDQVEQAISIAFPGYPGSNHYILEYALASLDCHREYLKKTLPASHGLFCTPLFTTNTMLNKLADRLQGGTLQPHHETGVTAMVNRLQQVEQPGEQASLSSEQRVNLQQWTGRFNSIPSSFTIPECTIYQAWMLWQCGSPGTHIPPLRLGETCQLASKNAKKRLSDFAYLNRAIEKRAAALGLTYANLTICEAEEVFKERSSTVQLPTTISKGRKRRRGQLLWRTIVNELRAPKSVRQSSTSS
ncbi:hypothetical protein F442_15187 [Phytophthora nicotianae P10297]|uniref:Uncharacterized protein n=1 Tax=Phytophthora nicotianae P10297 TaxID=1317064 RepID=W2YQN6_PHYNI|nr:hypothetical protein F442_15187 [Phytophthora nicotianae P10297]